MNRVLTVLRGRTAQPVADRHLLDRFLGEADEAAFAELIRRYGPVVWGACRRTLANVQDAEDAFQAAFLVLLRRAAKLDHDTPLGPWLYQVAVLTARGVVRANRRRSRVTGPMERELPAAPTSEVEKLDLDAALLALSERERAAVVLCHLQGFTRREAAERLGCPEGTLSARLNRALSQLRVRLGAGALATLAAGGGVPPAGLAATTARSASVYSTSALAAPGLSPAVAQLTDGVLRMFWMKKLLTASALAVVLGAGALALGFAGRAGNAARATEPLAEGAAPPAAAADENDPLKRLEKRLADLEKQKELLDTTLEDLKAEKKKLEDAKKEKAAADAAAELGRDIAVVVGDTDASRPLVVREVVNGRVAEVTCSNLDVLTTYLRRAHADPRGPKVLRITAHTDHPMTDLRKVFAACAAGGYATATFSQTERPKYRTVSRTVHVYESAYKAAGALPMKRVELPPNPGEIDLTKYAAPKKQP